MKSEVVIIGGGVIGCSIAYQLARRNAKTVLIEKGDIASEGSGYSSGGIRQIGREDAEFGLMADSVKIWRGLEDEINQDFGLVRGGNLYVAQEERDTPMVRGVGQQAVRHGVAAKELTTQEARKLVPQLEGPFVGAVFCADDLHADPARATKAIGAAAQKHGAEVMTNTTAVDIIVRNGRIDSVVTDKGDIETSVVVNAAGMWAPRVAEFAGLRFPIKLVRYSSMESDRQPHYFDAFVRASSAGCKQYSDGRLRFGGGWNNRVAHDLDMSMFEDIGLWLPRLARFRKTVKFSVDYDAIKRDFQRLVLRQKVFPPKLVPKYDRAILDRGRKGSEKLMPFLKEVAVTRMLAGYLDLSPDMLPTIGPLANPQGLIFAAGFSGHGFGIAQGVAKAVSELIVDGKPSQSLHEFRHSRFKEGAVSLPERFL